MTDYLLIIAVITAVNAFICMYRAIAGPTAQDRLLAVNIMGTKTLIVVVLVTYAFGESFFLDVAMVYALLNFVVTVALCRYLETEGWEGEVAR